MDMSDFFILSVYFPIWTGIILLLSKKYSLIESISINNNTSFQKYINVMPGIRYQICLHYRMKPFQSWEPSGQITLKSASGSCSETRHMTSHPEEVASYQKVLKRLIAIHPQQVLIHEFFSTHQEEISLSGIFHMPPETTLLTLSVLQMKERSPVVLLPTHSQVQSGSLGSEGLGEQA